ncbi:hypothetical protein ACVWYP_008465 [Bradyrhizobium sp. USDA 3262]
MGKPTAGNGLMLSDCSTGPLNGKSLHRNPALLTVHPGKDDSVPLDRDLRLDLCRGLALWCVFLDHIPKNVFSWLTLRHYGFSDATEVFMFVSGVTCALSYSSVRRRDGWATVLAHTLLRSWEIYAAFLILTIALAIVAYSSGSNRLADEANVKILLQEPGAALAHAAILMYRPVNTDVLPTFVLFHLSFAPALWGISKFPGASLLISAFLYALVQLYGWNLPQWPVNLWYFNPFAWQLLVVLGAWWAIRGYRMFGRKIASWPVVALAIAYLGFGLVITLSWQIEPLAAAVPSYIARLIYPIDKPDLDPPAAPAFSGNCRRRGEVRAAELARTCQGRPEGRNSLRRAFARNLLCSCRALPVGEFVSHRSVRQHCGAVSDERRRDRGARSVCDMPGLDR